MSTTSKQHSMYAGHLVEWEVDLGVLATILPWAAHRPAVLEGDLTGMARYFPHWLLVGFNRGHASTCPACRLPAVATNRAVRCPACQVELPADQFLWLGQIPALVRPEPAFQPRRQALQQAGFAEVHSPGSPAYMLVPLSVAYPSEWPNSQPVVCYAPAWLDAIGLPRASAAHHLVGVGQACIFAWGQWEAMAVHTVLQQRMVNHIASLLKIATGMPPAQAFIGRIY